jgi:hypothetical protein
MKGKILVVLVAGLAALMMVPMGDSFHGSMWRARDLPATNLEMGLDHTLHPFSTATNLATGQVLRADVQWSGEQFVGANFNGLLTLKFFDDAGNLVHQATIPALEDISNVHWLQCPVGTGDAGADLETLPTYSMVNPGILSLGPGAPGGTGQMRNSFCGNFNDPADPFYFKGFSDYEGTYLPSVLGTLGAYRLHLHVRGADHG